jgi:hypothetical protein
MPIDIPPEARDAVPGIFGAFVAVSRTQGPLKQRALSFMGGSSLSYFCAGPFATAMGMTLDGRGFAGFVLGVFGMAVVAKIYEAIDQFAAGDLSRAVLERFRKALGE